MSWIDKNWKPLTVVGGLLGLSWFAGKRFERAEKPTQELRDYEETFVEVQKEDGPKEPYYEVMVDSYSLSGLNNGEFDGVRIEFQDNLSGEVLSLDYGEGGDEPLMTPSEAKENYKSQITITTYYYEPDANEDTGEWFETPNTNIWRGTINFPEGKQREGGEFYARVIGFKESELPFESDGSQLEAEKKIMDYIQRNLEVYVRERGEDGNFYTVYDAENFEAERIKYDFIVHREPKGTKIGKDGKRIPNPKGGWFKSVKDAETFDAEGMPFGVHVKNHKTTSTVFYKRKPFRRFRGSRHKEKAESYAQFMEKKLKSNPNRFSYFAETFEAYDPMMQNRIDRNECSHSYDDGDSRGGDAWVLKYADLMGVEDGLSYIEAGVKCGICGQERIGSWGINEREGFQITKGEEGRMPRFYGYYGAETFDAQVIACDYCDRTPSSQYDDISLHKCKEGCDVCSDCLNYMDMDECCREHFGKERWDAETFDAEGEGEMSCNDKLNEAYDWIGFHNGEENLRKFMDSIGIKDEDLDAETFEAEGEGEMSCNDKLNEAYDWIGFHNGEENLRKFMDSIGIKDEDLDAETFEAEKSVHQLIIHDGVFSDTYVYENENQIKEALYDDFYGGENLLGEEGYVDSDDAEEDNKKLFMEKTKNMSINDTIDYLQLDMMYYEKSTLDLDKDFIVDGENGGIKQGHKKYGAENFGAESYETVKSRLDRIPEYKRAWRREGYSLAPKYCSRHDWRVHPHQGYEMTKVNEGVAVHWLCSHCGTEGISLAEKPNERSE